VQKLTVDGNSSIHLSESQRKPRVMSGFSELGSLELFSESSWQLGLDPFETSCWSHSCSMEKPGILDP
jgi:hypothetical protein